MTYTIAIDGPVGAGKSSVADKVASRLGILHLDTGAMYRAFAWSVLKNGISTDDENSVSELAGKVMPEVRFENGQQRTYISGRDVTGEIRTPEISMAASSVSRYTAVRSAMVKRQQEMAKQQSMLLDGRDIGTRVLPDATLKIYLTATAEERARRRYEQMTASGNEMSFDAVLKDVIARDEQDMNRKVDPLRAAEDAEILDSTSYNEEQTVQDILRRLDMKLGRMPKREEKFAFVNSVTRVLGGIIFRVFLPVEIHNYEQLSMDPPMIIISNHNSLLDPIMIGWKCYRFNPRFMGKKELAKNPIAAWYFKEMQMITVDRHHTDMGAMRAALKVLKDKRPLGIFPEGTRHKEGIMKDIESGIGLLALKGGCDMIPVFIDGKPKLFRKLHLYVGQPIHTKDIAAQGINKESCDLVLERIRSVYDEMVKKYHK